jgi:hypothetical protein
VNAADPGPLCGTEDNEELSTVFDEYGRGIKFTRSEWRDKARMPNLRNAWDQPAEIYRV